MLNYLFGLSFWFMSSFFTDSEERSSKLLHRKAQRRNDRSYATSESRSRSRLYSYTCGEPFTSSTSTLSKSNIHPHSLQISTAHDGLQDLVLEARLRHANDTAADLRS